MTEEIPKNKEQHSNQLTAAPHTSFICSKCNVSYPSEKELMGHFSQDWHKYNVKRSMVSLGPVSEETFKDKIEAALRQMENPEDKKKILQNESSYCEACSKKFANSSTYKQHFQSNAHKKNQKNLEMQKKEEGHEEKEKKVSKTTLEDIGVCLFCNFESENLETNMIHMQRAHNFFLPDSQNILSLEKIIGYLAGKIHRGLLCIYCDNVGCKDFKSGQAVQGHMRDKLHFTIDTDNMNEYFKFYAYEENKTLGKPEKLTEEKEENHKKGKKNEEKKEDMEIEIDKKEPKIKQESEEEEWEDESEEGDWEDEDSEEIEGETEEEKEARERKKKEILKQYPYPKVYSKQYRQKKMDENQLEVLPSGELMIKGRR